MAWIYLFIAGAFEVGWPLGLKFFDKHGHFAFLVLAIVSMGISGWFLILAQKTIPIGTAYAVWTGIGAAGTFLLGILIFSDAVSLLRFLGLILILGGVITLKLAP